MGASSTDTGGQSSLDLLSGVAAQRSHARELERRHKNSARDVAHLPAPSESPPPALAQYQPPQPASGPGFHSVRLARESPKPSAARPVNLRAASACVLPSSTRSDPTSLNQITRSTAALPPATSGLVARPAHRVYMHSDLDGRAVAQLQLDPTGRLAALALGRSAPVTASLSVMTGESPHTVTSTPSGNDASGGPRGMPMIRQHPNFPFIGDDRPSAPVRTPTSPLPSSRTSMIRRTRTLARSEQASPPPGEPQSIVPAKRRASLATMSTFETSVAGGSQQGDRLDSARHETYGRVRSPVQTSLADAAKTAVSVEDDRDPIVSCTLWEDERTVVMQVLVDGHVVARRADTDWINSTKLLNMVVGMTRGKRDMYLKNEPERIVFRRGALHLKGVWLPRPAAMRLARAYGLLERLYPLFEDDIRSFLFRPINWERTTQLVIAARAREALVQKPDVSSGLSEELREELRVRGEELERLLTFLERGLGMREPASPDPSDASVPEEADPDGSDSARQSRVAGFHTAQLLSEQHPLSRAEGRCVEMVESPSPPTPPPTGGLAQSAALQQQYSLGASYRTRFSQPPGVIASVPNSLPSLAPRRDRSDLRLGSLPSLLFSTDTEAIEAAPSCVAPERLRHSSHEELNSLWTARQPVSWFDNPTPPERAAQNYFSFSVSESPATRRQSTSHERSGGITINDEEMVNQRDSSEANAAAPPPVNAQNALRRPASDGALARLWTMTTPRTKGKRFLSLSAKLPDATGDPVTRNSVQPLSPSSQEASGSYESLVAQLLESIRSPAVKAVPSPLSRFSATRISVDSAFDAVAAHAPGFISAGSSFAPTSTWHVPMSLLSGAEAQEAKDRALLRELLGRVNAPHAIPSVGGDGSVLLSSGSSLSEMDVSPIAGALPGFAVAGSQQAEISGMNYAFPPGLPFTSADSACASSRAADAPPSVYGQTLSHKRTLDNLAIDTASDAMRSLDAVNDLAATDPAVKKARITTSGAEPLS